MTFVDYLGGFQIFIDNSYKCSESICFLLLFVYFICRIKGNEPRYCSCYTLTELCSQKRQNSFIMYISTVSSGFRKFFLRLGLFFDNSISSTRAPLKINLLYFNNQPGCVFEMGLFFYISSLQFNIFQFNVIHYTGSCRW